MLQLATELSAFLGYCLSQNHLLDCWLLIDSRQQSLQRLKKQKVCGHCTRNKRAIWILCKKHLGASSNSGINGGHNLGMMHSGDSKSGDASDGHKYPISNSKPFLHASFWQHFPHPLFCISTLFAARLSRRQKFVCDSKTLVQVRHKRQPLGKQILVALPPTRFCEILPFWWPG